MSDLQEHLQSALADRYTIERVLGRGGMAVVYLARDRHLDRDVALKVLRPELAASLGANRFLREIDIAAKLTHPNILALHDSGHAAGQLYYTMPYLDGESLRDRLNREKQLRIQDALQITREVADALAHAHALGVVHRDIKPENIILQGGHAVVADFGIARAVTEAGGPRLTETGLAIGTPAYMSPEQASGSAEVDARSDIYSLACVLYEMLSGEMLYTGPSGRAVIAKVLSLPPTPIRMLRPRVPEGVERALLIALDKSAVDRFATIAEFTAALDAGASDEDTWLSGGTEPPVRRPVRTLARALGLGAAYLGTAVVLFTVLGFLTAVTYDVKMGVPPDYSPSRTDFPIVGLRAVAPALIFGFAMLAAILVLKYVMRLPLLVVRRLLGMGPAIDEWVRRSTGGWRKLWGRVRSTTVAELFLVATPAMSFVVMLPYGRLLTALWTEETDVLACSFRPTHESYTFAMIVLIGIVTASWVGVSRYLRRRRTRGIGAALVRWGGLAWIVTLLMILTMPWQLLWLNDHPRVLVNDERGYVLLQEGSNLVIYNAVRQSTRLHRLDETLDLELLNTIGYVFESPEEFASDSGC